MFGLYDDWLSRETLEGYSRHEKVVGTFSGRLDNGEHEKVPREILQFSTITMFPCYKVILLFLRCCMSEWCCGETLAEEGKQRGQWGGEDRTWRWLPPLRRWQATCAKSPARYDPEDKISISQVKFMVSHVLSNCRMSRYSNDMEYHFLRTCTVMDKWSDFGF